MKIIYVLMENDNITYSHDVDSVVGVYDSYEKAKNRMKELSNLDLIGYAFEIKEFLLNDSIE